MVDEKIVEGIVLLGTGGEISEWEQGVIKILKDEAIISGPECFGESIVLKTTGGRTDLLMPFAENAKIHIAKLAMWRLAFGDCSWLSDYKVNYADQHGYVTAE